MKTKKDIILAHALKPDNWRPAWKKISNSTGIPVSTVYSSLHFEKFELTVKHVPRTPPMKCLNPGCKNRVKTKGWCSVECHQAWARGDVFDKSQ